jgi:hypothetical protein
MRTLAGFSMALLTAGALFAQVHSTAPFLTGGFGKAVYPAGPHLVIPGSTRRAPVTRGNGAVVIPYAYPVYIGSGYMDGSYAQAPAAQQPNVTVVYPPQPAPVIINQFGPGAAPPAAYPQEPVSPYQAAAPQAEDQAPADHFLIALNDHTIYSVVAYWVDGDTLHYFTAGNVHNQASLSLVDRALTARLNKETGLEVKLPAPK